jgi:hypothetical protein
MNFHAIINDSTASSVHIHSPAGTCIHTSKDEQQLKLVVAAMEAELSVADSNLEVSRLHLASVQEERLRLLCSPTDRHKLHE